MDPVRIALLVLHISAAAILIGASAGLVRNLKKTLEAGKAAFVIATEDAARRAKLMGICSLVTIGTGLCLIFLMGGFAVAPLNFHMALGIMLVAVLFSALFMRPATVKLVKLAQAEPFDPSGARSQIKKLAMGQGILHLLWVVTLVLMLVRIYR